MIVNISNTKKSFVKITSCLDAFNVMICERFKITQEATNYIAVTTCNFVKPKKKYE